MLLMGWQVGFEFRRCGAAAVIFIACGIASAATTKDEHPAQPVPSERISADSLGYLAPSPAYLSYRVALSTLDFIDNDHLLFTFHVNRLMPRIPDDPADDEDQMIHAVVLEIKGGKVIQQADWRMHDRQQYLWALNDGHFLVRQRNALFLTDAHLQLRPYLAFDTDLEALEISPDRKLMLLETAQAAATQASRKQGPSLLGSGSSATDEPQVANPRRRTELILMQPDDKTVIGKSEVPHVVDPPLTDDGFIAVVQGGDLTQWVLRKSYLRGETKEFGKLHSSCAPSVQLVSETAVLVMDCPPTGAPGNHLVMAMSTEGGTLWTQQWSGKFIWPDFGYSTDGSRFAYESLEMNREIGTLDTFGAEDVKAQPVGVFDTESGKLEMVEDASPILSGGRNFALSADGRRFAILRHGAIEVYDLPPVPAAAKKENKK
jgi:hypothetical protein